MRNRTPKLLALALAAVMTMGMTVSAATVPDNPAGQTTNVNSGDTMQNNNGIVMYNYGEVINNNNAVQNNHGIVQNNHGIVQNNNGIVQNNYGTVKNPTGGSLVLNNFGGDVEGGAIDQY